MEFLIKPHDGIGPIKFGMPREQVKELFAGFFTLSETTAAAVMVCLLSVDLSPSGERY